MSKGYEVVEEVSFPDLGKLKAKLEKEYSKKVTAARMEKALEPVVEFALGKLKSYVRSNHMGPTGNLLAGAMGKVERYDKDGNAVGLVGFRAISGEFSSASSGAARKGPDRAFHAGLLEFGTKQRKTKKAFASSFARFGPFKIIGDYPPVKTMPAYPNAFFKRAKRGQVASTGKVAPLQPIKRTFDQSKTAIESSVKRSAGKQLMLANTNVARLLPAK